MKQPAADFCLSSPHLDGVPAWITVDGKPVKVLNAHTEGSKTSAVVEAKPGSTFEFVYGDVRSKAPRNSYMTSVYWNGDDVQTILTGTRDDCFKADVEDRSRYVILTGGTGTSGIPVTFCFPSAAKSSSQSEVSTTAAASIVELRFWRVKNIKTRKGNNSWTYFDDEDTPFFTLEFECRATAASLAKKMPPVNKPSAPLVAGRFRQHTPARTRSADARSPSTPFTSLFANTPPSPRAASPVSSARTSIAVRATPAVASTSKAAATTSAATIIDLTESSPDPPPPQPVPPSLTPAVAHTQQKLSKRDPDVEAAEKELKRLRREARMEQLEDFIAAKKGGDYDEMPSDGARVKLE